MELKGNNVYLTPQEEALIGMSSPVPTELAFSLSPGLMAKSAAFSESIQQVCKTQAEVHNESRLTSIRSVGRAISRHDFRMASHAVVPALRQLIHPDHKDVEAKIDDMSNQACLYGNLGNALRRASDLRAKHLADPQSESDIVATAEDMTADIDAYLQVRKMEE